MELSSLVASVTLLPQVSSLLQHDDVDRLTQERETYIREFGFFFFLRMAVAVSST